jgi:FkbM family methyltransferase
MRSIIRRLNTLARNPSEFFAQIRRRLSIHDHFYYALLKEGVVRYDKRNKTYLRDVKGHEFHLNPKDRGLSRVLARDGIREKESVDALYKYVTPDMTIFDLGANIGFYVLLEAQIVSKGQGRIWAVEPDPENLRFLKLNVEANNYSERVDIYQAAICDRSGPVNLELYPASNSQRLAGLWPAKGCIGTIEVPGLTFRDFLKRTGLSMAQLNFLRMDVEGAEYEILLDIVDLLETKESFLMFIEFHPHINERKHRRVLENLESIGFRCLTATKEYPENNKIARVHCLGATMKQLYTDEFFLQWGGCEVFLERG